MAEPRDFKQIIRPNWCPGCGDFAVLKTLPEALANLNLKPHQVATVTGIGCAGRIAGYLHTYGFHAIHGRALPLAQGVKLANRKLTVVAVGGDGDGFGIGLNHFLHAVRRNVDLTYIVIDNHIYGLTKGQASPTSPAGFKSKTTPQGTLERSINPLQLALSAGIGYLAQGFTGNTHRLTELIEGAIRHRGFSLVVVYSPCVTYNRINTLKWYRENLVDLDQLPGYNPRNKLAALEACLTHDELVQGLVYEADAPDYQELWPGKKDQPLVLKDLTPSQQLLDDLMQEFY